MSNLTNIIDQLDDLDKLKAYAKAQFTTLIELNKKNQRLEEELRDIKSKHPESHTESKLIKLDASDEEIICKIQLDILKKKALNGEEFTLDDTKRVETFTKILHSIKNKVAAPESKLSDAELLKIVDLKVIKTDG
jgi:hypothetical protein